jgi:hypothetical protein
VTRRLFVLVVALLALWPLTARAQQPGFEVGVLGGPTPLTYAPGMIELFARIDNPGGSTLAGALVVSQLYQEHEVARVEFSASPGGVALVRLPLAADGFELVAEVRIGAAPVFSQTLTASRRAAVRVFDAAEPSRLRGTLASTSIFLRAPPPGAPRTGTVIEVASPPVDASTGAPILPTYVSSWHGVSLIHITASGLTRLTPQELLALTGHVLAGATLAVAIERPEDLRSPVVARLVGGTPRAEDDTNAASRERFELPIAGPVDSFDWMVTPPGVRFRAYEGGNLSPNVFGAAATYGLGEVVLLGFDTLSADVASAPWTRVRLAELARRANSRAGTAAVRPGDSATPAGGPPATFVTEPVARLLDPGVGAQWGIGVASLFLCGYAVLAGPISFQRAKKAGRPLRALLVLPLLSALAFLLIVAFGFIAKGTSVRAREVVFVEAGAGMSTGAARRYRGFFSPFSQTVSVRPRAQTNTIDTWGVSERRSFVVDGQGVRVEGVEAPPSETVIFTEDGLFAIGDGVSIVREGSELAIENRTPWELRALILRASPGDVRYLQRLGPGARVVSSAMEVSANLEQWESRATLDPSEPLGGYEITSELEQRGESELAPIWAALGQTARGPFGPGGSAETLPAVNWLPSSTPVLLALAVEEGGSDSGVPRERAVIALRIVGLGAAQ